LKSDTGLVQCKEDEGRHTVEFEADEFAHSARAQARRNSGLRDEMEIGKGK